MATNKTLTGPVVDHLNAFLTWLELDGKAKGTLLTYGDVVRRLIVAHPEKDFPDFTHEDLIAFLDTLPPHRRAPHASVLRSWFKWGARARRISDDPARLLPAYEWTRSGPISDVFSEEEIDALEDLPDPDGTLMALMFETGLAKSEARSLRANNFDLAKRRMHVVEGSRGSGSRYVPIDKSLAQRVALFFKDYGIAEEDYVWPTRPGGGRVKHDRPISPPSFHHWWGRCLTAAGVANYRSPKQARHTCALRLRDRGMHLDDVQKFLGHNSYYTTMGLYRDVRFDDVEKRFHELPRP